jgi:hypothetical protein
MKKLKVELSEWEAKLLLEAVAELETKWSTICDTSDDPDEVADYGNDLIELRMVKESVTAQAVEAFGPAVTNFDRTSL